MKKLVESILKDSSLKYSENLKVNELIELLKNNTEKEELNNFINEFEGNNCRELFKYIYIKLEEEKQKKNNNISSNRGNDNKLKYNNVININDNEDNINVIYFRPKSKTKTKTKTKKTRKISTPLLQVYQQV